MSSSYQPHVPTIERASVRQQVGSSLTTDQSASSLPPPEATAAQPHEADATQAGRRSEAGSRRSAAATVVHVAEVLVAGGRRSAAGADAAKKAQQAHAEHQKDRVKALRATAAAKPAKQLSPLVMARLKKAEERARHRTVRSLGVMIRSSTVVTRTLIAYLQEMLAIKRAKHIEKERAAEARERSLMHAEEWHQERVKWSKIWGGRDGTWRTVCAFPRHSVVCHSIPGPNFRPPARFAFSSPLRSLICTASETS